MPKQPQPMPAGGTWQGFYQGPNYIYLRIATNGTQATGEWRSKGQRRGELEGTIRGGLLDYRWREESLNPGNRSSASGRGYFVYRITPEGHEIVGLASMGPRDTGTLRLAKKRLDVPADASEGLFMEGDPTAGGDADVDECYGCGFDEVEAGDAADMDSSDDE
jgi:hypothetical protein